MNATSGIPLPLTPALTRECDCPEWVLRCVHFGEETRTLWQWLSKPLPNNYWAVGSHVGPVVTGRCDCGECSSFIYDNVDARSYLYSGTSEADALAAFYAAELELLARDEA